MPPCSLCGARSFRPGCIRCDGCKRLFLRPLPPPRPAGADPELLAWRLADTRRRERLRSLPRPVRGAHRVRAQQTRAPGTGRAASSALYRLQVDLPFLCGTIHGPRPLEPSPGLARGGAASGLSLGRRLVVLSVTRSEQNQPVSEYRAGCCCRPPAWVGLLRGRRSGFPRAPGGARGRASATLGSADLRSRCRELVEQHDVGEDESFALRHVVRRERLQFL